MMRLGAAMFLRNCRDARAVALSATILSLYGTAATALSQVVDTRVVRYELTARAPTTWSLDAKPAVEIGVNAVDGPSAFGDVVGVAMLGDGSLAVADARANEVRVFSGDGRFLRAFGRAGQGPGEFDRIVWSLYASGDRILATDNSGRAHVFTAFGTLLNSRARLVVAGTFGPQRIGLFSDGSIAVAAYQYPPDTTQNEFEVLRVLLREHVGETATRIERVVVTPGYVRQRPTTVTAAPLVYGATHTLAANHNRICGGNSATFRISCFDTAGREVYRVERATTQLPVTPELRALAREAYIAANPSSRLTADQVIAVQRQAQLLRFPEYAPAFGRVLVAPSGEVWVSNFDAGERLIGPKAARAPRTPVRWSVFSALGDWVADVQLPAHFIPHVVENAVVAGVSLDADGAERITVWRIRRPRAADSRGGQ